MKVGQRVKFKSGALQGEMATVTRNPKSGVHEHDGMVWITFDRHNVCVKVGPAYFTLSPSWYFIEELQVM